MTTVSTKTSAIEQMHRHLPLFEALQGGTDKMRLAGEKFLPMWPAEDPKHYEYRLSTSTLFPAFSVTVEALSGKPFSRKCELSEDAPANFREWQEDIDLEGRNLHSFAADVLEDAMANGMAGILVEYPKAEGVRTRAQEREAGARPYWVHIKLKQILGYQKARIAGDWVLTQLRFMEEVCEPDGEWGEKAVEQIRVLEPGSFRIYRKNEKDDWLLHEEGTTSLNAIPFVPVYGQRRGFMQAQSPLLDLAFLNVKHWQSQSCQDTILRVARVPILMLSGVQNDGPVVVGMKAITSTAPDAKGMFIEHSGKAIGAGQESLDKLETQMRHAGAQLLVEQPVKSVAQWSGEADAKMAPLKRITLDYQDALNQALELTARWVGESNAPTLELFSDFGSLSLDQASAELLEKLGAAGVLSKQTIFEEAKRRSVVRYDRTWEDELDRLAEEGPALGEIPSVEPSRQPSELEIAALELVRGNQQ